MLSLENQWVFLIFIFNGKAASVATASVTELHCVEWIRIRTCFKFAVAALRYV